MPSERSSQSLGFQRVSFLTAEDGRKRALEALSLWSVEERRTVGAGAAAAGAAGGGEDMIVGCCPFFGGAVERDEGTVGFSMGLCLRLRGV